MQCKCSGVAAAGFQQLDAVALDQMKAFAASSASAETTTSQIWMLGGQLCPVTGTADGKKGCVTFSFLGVPIKLCWEILSLDPIPPAISVKIRLSVSVAGTEYYSVILLFKCDNISDPGTCSVTAENDLAAVAAFKPKCDWGCLRDCAPACLSCGSNYWCWAACASGCVLRCCRFL